ncbi:molybdopterin cofactor-binding domain-containing protein [Haliangium sp.]|uniref:xanthine dehydrogenase family protein molybdopterin-binding subunit n=1 Tax=Haliangium sp. TaxID=2663208 RepID=UPI003D101A1F
MASTIDRRRFLQVTAAGGGSLLVGFSLFGCKESNQGQPPAPAPKPGTPPAKAPAGTGEPAEFNAWVRIDPDDTVVFSIDKAEMGQGVLTSLAMILADELDADWSKVKSVHAPANQTFYGFQLTGGSTSVRMGYENLRKAGAGVRAMLVEAAAGRWGVDAAGLTTRAGAVVHSDGKQTLRYGELAADAAKRTPPEEPTLKQAKDFRFIGTEVKRLDTPAKINGTAEFGIDVQLPDMLVAQVEHSPTFGGKVASFDAAAAEAVPGVRKVVEIPSGVAVVADHFWAAKKGREALSIKWDEGAHAAITGASINETMRALVDKGKTVHSHGEPDKAATKAKKKLEAAYELPYLAHAAMEPLNCTVSIADGGCQVWTGTQAQVWTQQVAAQIAGVPAGKVEVHTTMLGGGFGRRANTDFIADAVHVAKAMGKPVKTIWTREDDTRAGFYRPVSYHAFTGAVDAEGWPNLWIHRISSPALTQEFLPRKDGVDVTTIEGAENMPYGIANVQVTCAHPELPIPTWFWRSVGSSHNAYVTECFMDELAALGGKDPLEVRLRLLADKPRHKRVLERAADKAGWGGPLDEGKARGLAVHEAFGSFVAEVVEVSIESGTPRVHRVVCAVDCGVAVNPNTIRAQMESGIVYGLSAALWGRIDIDKGRPVQSNFHDYRVLRMNEMPAIETDIIAEGDSIGGIGEPGTPPIAPALCNALRVLTGKPVRKLPVTLSA